MKAKEAEKPMAKQKKNAKWSVYSNFESRSFDRWQDTRMRWLATPLAIMTRAGLNANHVTSASAIVGLASAVMVYFNHTAFAILLALHVLLDGLDGPLARYQKTRSNGGMIADFFSDLAVVGCVTIGLTLSGYIDPVWGVTFSFCYMNVSYFGVLHNILGIKQPLAIRPRMVLYALAIMMPYFAMTYIVGLAAALLSVAMIPFMIADFFRIYRQAKL